VRSLEQVGHSRDHGAELADRRLDHASLVGEQLADHVFQPCPASRWLTRDAITVVVGTVVVFAERSGTGVRYAVHPAAEVIHRLEPVLARTCHRKQVGVRGVHPQDQWLTPVMEQHRPSTTLRCSAHTPTSHCRRYLERLSLFIERELIHSILTLYIDPQLKRILDAPFSIFF
jgi:hypothetical protein